jgi:hypothetical protein
VLIRPSIGSWEGWRFVCDEEEGDGRGEVIDGVGDGEEEGV